MTDFEGRQPVQFLAVLGGGLIVAGMIQVAPHLALSYQLGLSLCGADAAVGQVAAMMLQFGGHCPGCLVALFGAALMVLSQFAPKAANRLASI
ncbi:MAG: hypothetical protein AAFQ64_15390 [Pseudomonadota bacterium]